MPILALALKSSEHCVSHPKPTPSFSVVVTCPKPTAATQAVQSQFPKTPSTVKACQVDLEDDNSIRQAFEHISAEHSRIDVLINNAGNFCRILFLLREANLETGGQFDLLVLQGKMTMREMWNKSWDVNTTGTHILTHTFVPLLLKSSDPRLLFITSGTSTLAEIENTTLSLNKSPVKGWPKQEFNITAYRSSKTGMNMMMRDWIGF